MIETHSHYYYGCRCFLTDGSEVPASENILAPVPGPGRGGGKSGLAEQSDSAKVLKAIAPEADHLHPMQLPSSKDNKTHPSLNLWITPPGWDSCPPLPPTRKPRLREAKGLVRAPPRDPSLHAGGRAWSPRATAGKAPGSAGAGESHGPAPALPAAAGRGITQPQLNSMKEIPSPGRLPTNPQLHGRELPPRRPAHLLAAAADVETQAWL